MKWLRVIVVGTACILPTTALAQDAQIYVVHGINGTDLGLPEAAPVDVAVDGDCAVPGFEFKDIVGPVALGGGTHTVTVSLSDGSCGGDPVIDVEIELSEHRMYTAVAHLDTTGTPTASLFFNNQGATAEGFGKLVVRHLANAPEVDLTVRPAGDPSNPGIVFPALANGQQRTASLSAGNWRARILPAGSTEVLAGPVPTPIVSGEMLVVYALGSIELGTFELLSQQLELLSRPDEP